MRITGGKLKKAKPLAENPMYRKATLGEIDKLNKLIKAKKISPPKRLSSVPKPYKFKKVNGGWTRSR